MLHEKTHFKAAVEYSFNDNNQTKRSLNDRHREIEKYIEEAHFQMQFANPSKS